MSEQNAAPVRGKERIEFIDILRGFAVLGILVVNMYSFAGSQNGASNLGWPSGLDRFLIILSEFLIRAKFYTLFSFMFGWGMGLQMLRAQQKGVRFVPLYLRRLLILLAIGLIHANLIWRGDILTYYALLGFLLLLFRNQSLRRLLIVAALFLTIPFLINMPWDFVETFRSSYAEFLQQFSVDNIGSGGYANGTFAQITLIRLNGTIFSIGNMIYFIGNIFPMFLLGLYVAKRRIFESVEENMSLIRRALVVGLIVGVIFNGLFILFRLLAANNNWPTWLPVEYRSVLMTGSQTIGAPALAMFYASGFILLSRREYFRERLGSTLGFVGRMALTNYLMHSMILTVIFYGYGLGLYGRATPTICLILTVILFYIQIRYSRAWFEQYQYGPFEWVWRTLTYGRRQPWRIGETYNDVRPIPFISGRPFRIILGLLVTAALVFGLFRFVSSRSEDGTLALPGISPSPTVTPVVEEEVAAEETFTYIAPDVSPVAYNPGPLAAAGDLAALADQFDVERAFAEIEILAGPEFDGRLAGTEGGWAAGDYIAEQFEAAGLQPAGDDGSFFQAFPIQTTTLVSVPGLVIEGASGTTADYVLYQDFTPIVRGYSGEGSVSGQVVWVNNCEHDDFSGLDLVGKIAFCRLEFPSLAPRQAIEHGAVGLLMLAGEGDRALDLGVPYGESWVPEDLSIPTYSISEKVAQDLLTGSGLTFSELSLSFESFPLVVEATLTVDTQGSESCTNQPCMGRNILGVIPGRDPEYADEVVIIGGHYDHIGQGPEGTTWAGANDNASGISVILEIARTWQEQGFVPRRTVLFAAWDAEEMGLVGSVYYVNHPRYLRQDTVAVLNLDMVGAGEDTLYIDGGSELGSELRQIAMNSGVISPTVSNIGRSDHFPFQVADVPATMMIWFGGGDGVPSYHRPIDTPVIIEPEKLAISGRIANLAMLSWTEGQMALQEAADERAEAVLAGDESQFLASTVAEWRRLDEIWFEDVQTLEPITFDMHLSNALVVGQDAFADVTYDLNYLELDAVGETITRSRQVDLTGHFVFNGSDWQWAGSQLESADSETDGLTVWLPPGGTNGASIAAYAQERYQAITTQLGLPQETTGSLRIFPTSESLRGETALTLDRHVDNWAGANTLKLINSNILTSTERFETGLVQLALLEAGLTETAVPWLWRGLGPALAGADDPVATQTQYLPELVMLFSAEAPEQVELSDSVAPDWAAVEYVREQVGWTGLGELISALGQACQSSCQQPADLDDVLLAQLGLNNDELSEAWKESRVGQLVAMEAALNVLLADRMEAVAAGDKTAFLATVDDSVPGLLAEQSHWFDDLTLYPTETFTLTGRPLAIYDDGRVLAEVDLTYALTGLDGRWAADETTTEVLLTPSGSDLLWADVPLERLPGTLVDVYYPTGSLEAAILFQAETEAMYQEIAIDLGIDFEIPVPLTPTEPISASEEISGTSPITATDSLTTSLPATMAVTTAISPTEQAPVSLKLYRSQNAFRQSVFLSFPYVSWLPAWTAPDEALKLPIGGDLFTINAITNTAGINPYRPALANYLTRNMLYDLGVETEWLVSGMAAYETGQLTGISPASDLRDVIRAIENDTLPSLGELGQSYRLDENGFEAQTVHSWDAVRFLVENYGLDSMASILEGVGLGRDLNVTMTQETGQPLADFEADWLASVSQAHIQPAWTTVAESFSPDLAEEHMTALTAPEMNGRQVGSPGSQLAAEYIAGKFEEYGLEPVGTADSYFQPFDIDYVTWASAPALEVTNDSGDILSLHFRQEFVVPLTVTQSSEVVSGELVYVFDETYEGLDLTDKIVLRFVGGPIEEELAKAYEHGAIGLILVSNLDFEKDIVTKQALPVQISETLPIPVMLLTRPGFDMLLESAGWTRADVIVSPPARSLEVDVRLQLPYTEPEVVEVANVLGMLTGSDPNLQDEFVILGAHYDHVGNDPDLLLCDGQFIGSTAEFDESTCERLVGLPYTGLIDNASGVAALLEVARLWQEMGYQPRRSVLFAAWAGQEANQSGSTYYVEHPVVPLEKTVASIQLDAVGGGSSYRFEGQGNWDTDGILMLPMDLSSDLLDVRIKIAGPDPILHDDIPFRAAGIPTLLLTWQDANEDNWPDHLADEYDPDFMYIGGRVLVMVLMTAAG